MSALPEIRKMRILHAELVEPEERRMVAEPGTQKEEIEKLNQRPKKRLISEMLCCSLVIREYLPIIPFYNKSAYRAYFYSYHCERRIK